MKLGGFLLLLLLTASTAFSQAREDSSFSLLFNTGVSFTHATDPHINRWLERYGYPTEPHVPCNFNFELAATPSSSRLLYSIKLSSIKSDRNLSSFNILGGLYYRLFGTESFLLFAGAGAGYHNDIIRLNGQLPPEYQQLAAQYPFPLALRRIGLFVEPGLRAFWYPVRIGSVQIGAYGGLGYDMYFNSHWRLGYYSNNHGKSGGHFKELRKPSDQLKVSEYGVNFSAGVSFRVRLH